MVAPSQPFTEGAGVRAGVLSTIGVRVRALRLPTASSPDSLPRRGLQVNSDDAVRYGPDVNGAKKVALA